MNIRKAAFAGSWYPATAKECEAQIQSFLQEGESLPDPNPPRIGGIVPHAGWFFSGGIACNVIYRLKNGEDPDTFIVFGMHLPPGAPRSILAEGGWETPFGPLEIDSELAGAIIKENAGTPETTRSFPRDNTVELQLPFLKYFFPDAKVVPVGAPPDESAIRMGRGIPDLAKSMGKTVKVIGSTDLTHYGPNYGFMPKGTGEAAVEWVTKENDREAINAMLRLDPESLVETALSNQNACCAGAAAAAMAAAAKGGASEATLMAYATSREKNPGASFVGYAGIVFSQQ